jgi:hypothetical protein
MFERLRGNSGNTEPVTVGSDQMLQMLATARREQLASRGEEVSETESRFYPGTSVMVRNGGTLESGWKVEGVGDDGALVSYRGGDRRVETRKIPVNQLNGMQLLPYDDNLTKEEGFGPWRIMPPKPGDTVVTVVSENPQTDRVRPRQIPVEDLQRLASAEA